jgi:predicted nucleic acid-binding protein
MITERGAEYVASATPPHARLESRAHCAEHLRCSLWAYAEHYGLSPLYSEDLQHDRLYGTVRVIDPFRR